jgi:hypothetical protein
MTEVRRVAKPRNGDATLLLSNLFDECVGPQAQVCIWSLPSKRPVFHSSVGQAVSDALDRGREDVYFGTCLYRAGIEPPGRGTAKDVVRVPALWADFDFGQYHKKKRVPGDITEAMGLVRRVGLKPSILVHSGHGLHAYWVLGEALDPEEAQLLSRRWALTVSAVARGLDFQIDSVFDLSRVLRVPETLNHKSEPPQRVHIFELYPTGGPPCRYSLSNFEQFAIDEAYDKKATPKSKIHVDAVELHLTADPPSQKFNAIYQGDARFRKTWDHQRPDLHDPSPSGYDLSIASQLAAFGWADQEIADAVVKFRRLHDLDVAKAFRRDYIQRTIAKARMACTDKVQTQNAIEEIRQLNVKLEAAEKVEDADRRMALERIHRAIGIPIVRWEQFGTFEATYTAWILDKDGVSKEYELGPAEKALEQKEFRKSLYVQYRRRPYGLSDKNWTELLNLLANIGEVHDTKEGGLISKVGIWIENYVALVRPHAWEDRDRACGARGSIYREKDNLLHINFERFRHFLKTTMGVYITVPELRSQLRAAGWCPDYIKGKPQKGKRKSFRYWRNDASQFTPLELHEVPDSEEKGVR